MKQYLPDVIRENEDLRKILLSQEGGIMKYWAEHPDANGTAALYSDYQNQCVEEFFEKNKWDMRRVWEGGEMRRTALGEMEHLWKEVRYQRVLLTQLSDMPADIVDKVELFTEQYLTYAYNQNRLRRYPNGITHTDVYREIIEMYSMLGLAYKCMEIILNEHHAKEKKEKIEKTDSELFTEFLIHQYSKQLTLGVFSQMRQTVAEMVEGKTDEQCRQMAIDTMIRLRGFSQMIYSDEVVDHLRKRKYIEKADQREKDGKWLRDVAEYTVYKELSTKVKTHSMRYYYADFVNILKDVGRIWAAQLLVHGIDMHKLEKKLCCILNPTNDLQYYVDKFYSDDMPGRYCITNIDVAEKLLHRIVNDEQSERKADSDEKSEIVENHNWEYYGKDLKIFHDNLDTNKIAEAVMTLPRGDVKSHRKFFYTVYTAFDTLHWLTCNTMTKFISWMKFHSKIYFETNNFKNIDFDADMELLLPRILEVFSTEVSEGCYEDKDYYYKKDKQGLYLKKINTKE